MLASVDKIVTTGKYAVMGLVLYRRRPLQRQGGHFWMAVQLSAIQFSSEAVGWVRWTYRSPN